jgi:hypothetical protein
MLEDAPRPRPAGGAVGPSPREAADQFRSGARPPAGTEPGNRDGPQHPVDPRSRWSRDGWRSVSQCRQQAGTGPGSWVNSCSNWTMAASTTATLARSPWRSGRYWRHSGAGSTPLGHSVNYILQLCPSGSDDDWTITGGRHSASLPGSGGDRHGPEKPWRPVPHSQQRQRVPRSCDCAATPQELAWISTSCGSAELQ